MSRWNKFESKYIQNQNTAQQYYEGREITERQLRFADNSSYNNDYPAWDLPERQRPKTASIKPLGGRTGKSSYAQDYPGYYGPPPNKHPPERIPKGGKFHSATTHATDFPKWATKRPDRVLEDHSRPWEDRPFDGRTAYTDAFKARGPSKNQRAERVQPGPSGQFHGQTSYTADYPRKSVPTRPIMQERNNPIERLPFKAVTSYGQHFKGWQLPQRRMNLGVETVNDVFHVIIPKSASLPATGRYVFSTHRNSQATACILVLAGDESQASRNKLLGQFDMVNIPPQPRQVPAIEVKFRLSADFVLTVEARDPDTKRHKAWAQNKGAIVVKG
ncbi:hypothetical protein CYMTET_9996 [Cymbomonas tetramitiformis]|uniref:Uncharacterized protein n=1 Tax=Cymbomonas tetramitiformis TaxID=36881 RepID=A0AAE0LEL0_9CHLO|nr:hypothetical protein CYMTET_9996 [Cymbomonas tetramitiformis]